MTEALSAVRRSLGPDALILRSRTVPAGDGARVEITAMNDDAVEVYEEETEKRGTGETENRRHGESGKRGEGELKVVREEIAEVRDLLSWFLPGTERKGATGNLLEQGLSPDIIARLAREAGAMGRKDDRERVFAALARLIPCEGEFDRRGERQGRLALIGPTGVGKTSGVIKLTVRLAGQQGCRVGWIGLESRRSVAADLLASYCGIVGVPYQVADDRASLAKAFENLSECDWVLVDTPGLSPRDESAVEELADSLRGVADLRRALLLSASTNGRDMADWVELYGKVGFDSLAFTKVDECRYFGPLINTAIGCGRPLSYISVGQDMVKDLEMSRPELLASLLLSGRDNDDSFSRS